MRVMWTLKRNDDTLFKKGIKDFVLFIPVYNFNERPET